MSELQVISRVAAYQQSKRRFYTGAPCRNGHVAERYVSNGACVACLNSAFKYRKNTFSHDLIPYVAPKLWIPKTCTQAHLEELQKYLQRCILQYTKHVGELPPDLEEAMLMQLERM